MTSLVGTSLTPGRLREARSRFVFSPVIHQHTVFFASSLPKTRRHILGLVVGQFERSRPRAIRRRAASPTSAERSAPSIILRGSLYS